MKAAEAHNLKDDELVAKLIDAKEEAFNLRKLRRELADPACTFLFAEGEGGPLGYALVRQGEPEP